MEKCFSSYQKEVSKKTKMEGGGPGVGVSNPEIQGGKKKDPF